MGSLLSKFRKQPTTTEQLKKIEDGLKKIEEYKRSTERKQKKTVANVLLYGVALYILACIIVFVWYLPESWVIRLGLVIPLVLVPVFIYYMRRIISVFFQRRMELANEEYEELKRKKKVIIDNVMETETFNKAKEILSKYAPETLEKKEKTAPILPKEIAGDLRKRTSSTINSIISVAKPQLVPAGAQGPATLRTDLNLPKPATQRTDLNLPKPATLRTDLYSPNMELKYAPTVQANIQLPQPLLSRERSFTDKLVEYIIGDGPSNRYALICKHCNGHNGMALKEEYPYMSFACCYCKKMNPSRFQRPTPPRLSEQAPVVHDHSVNAFLQPVMKKFAQLEAHYEEAPSTINGETDEGKVISDESGKGKTMSNDSGGSINKDSEDSELDAQENIVRDEEAPSIINEESDEGKVISEENDEGKTMSKDSEGRSINKDSEDSEVDAQENIVQGMTTDTIVDTTAETEDQGTETGVGHASHENCDQQPPSSKSYIDTTSLLEAEKQTM